MTSPDRMKQLYEHLPFYNNRSVHGTYQFIETGVLNDIPENEKVNLRAIVVVKRHALTKNCYYSINNYNDEVLQSLFTWTMNLYLSKLERAYITSETNVE